MNAIVYYDYVSKNQHCRIPRMKVDDTRRQHINFWADKLGRGALAKKCGYPDTVYINQLCAGHGSFGDRTARKLEKALGLTVGAFDTPITDKNCDPVSIIGKRIPLISFAQAGDWCEAVDPYQLYDAEDYLASPFEHSDKAFCVRVHGQSMFSPDRPDDGYPDGCIIQVEPGINPVHGDDVVVRTPDGDATFKRLQESSDGRYLLALNPDFPNRIIKVPEGTVICGVVTGYWVATRRGRK